MGLLDFVNTPEGQGLLSAAFGGLAGARRGTPLNNIGKAGVAGLLGYSNQQDRMSQEAQAEESRKFRAMQTSALQDQMNQRKMAMEQEAAKRAALPSLFAGTTVGGGSVTPEIAGIPMFSQGSTAVPTQTTNAGRIDYMRALQAGYTPEEIEKMATLPDAGRPQVARTADIEGPNGAKLIQGFDKFGNPVGIGASGYIAPVSVNQGDRQTFVKPTAGVSLPVNMSLSERDAAARGWASNNLQRERLNFDKAGGADGVGGAKAPSGYRWNADRTALEAIPGGPAGKADNATEGERKAATLMRRMEGSLNQLQSVTKENPSAASPNALAEAARSLPFVGGNTPANAVMSSDRQRVEAAQLDILDAALTLGTGAAYTREQLEGYRRSFFPQLMDSKATIQDKKERLDNVLEAARIAAGRAAPASQAKPSQSGSGQFKILSVE